MLGEAQMGTPPRKFNGMTQFSRYFANPYENYINRGVKNAKHEANMKNKNLEMMSVDELWSLYEETGRMLSTKLDAEKRELERRLTLLDRRIERKKATRRPYPKVHPKYRNPERPFETWSGRGKQPGWVGTQLRSGKKVDDLLIARTH
jgi:DNA-binding protein H-NS